MTAEADKIEGFELRLAIQTGLDLEAEAGDAQYEEVRFALGEFEDRIDPPLTVTLTREAAASLDESDLREALQTCRDAVVDVLGVASDEPGVTWRYEQRRAEVEGVHVEVRAERSATS
jgi:hypothetical protein